MRTVCRMRLQGAGNVRDLGDCPYGGTIAAQQCYYRGDMLDNLIQEDWKKLQEADIQLVLDFRGRAGQVRAPYNSERHGITRVSFPFTREEVPSADSLDGQAQKRFFDSMKLGYVDIVRAVPEVVCAAPRYIRDIEKAGRAVLSHYTAGKDRTGILATLLLKLCGVCNEDILTGYRASATYNASGVNRMLPAGVMTIPAVCALLDDTPDTLQPLLTALGEAGCFFHLKSIGMHRDELEELSILLQGP